MRKFYLPALIATAFSFLWLTGNCQFDKAATNILPSANAMSTAAQVNTPVNLFNGLPVIQASLGVLQARGGYEIPIALSYKAGGVKVQDIAGIVGLGWSINTNCLITRIVRGLPDEDASGYFGSNMGAKIEGVLDVQTLNGIRNGNLDAEPDLFIFNINGNSGKFVFDKNKHAVFLNSKEMKVINSPFLQEMGYAYWILSDISGNQYHFGTDQSSIETTQSIAYGESQTKTQTFTSSWYLKKIILANETETINYNYDAGAQIKTTYYSRTKRSTEKLTISEREEVRFLGIKLRSKKISSVKEVVDISEWNNNTEQIIASPKYLSSIVTSDQSAFFEYDTQNTRQDLANGLALKRMTIKSYTGEALKSYTFNYHYTFSNDKDNPQEVSTTNPDKYRLFLTNIQQSPGNAPSTYVTMFAFQYEDGYSVLPPRFSRRIDHWGFYNDQEYGYFPDLEYAQASSKDARSWIASAGSLKKIIYELGGSKEFLYNGNYYYDAKSKLNMAIGGLRIAQITTSDGNGGNNIEERYSYDDNEGRSTGKLKNAMPIYNTYISNSQRSALNQQRVYLPPDNINGNPVQMPAVPAFIDDFGGINGNVNPNFVPAMPISNGLGSILVNSITTIYDLIWPTTTTVEFYGPTLVRNFNTMNSIFDVDGNAIGYSQVGVKREGEGKTVYAFTDIGDYPDLSAQFSITGSFKTLRRLGPDEFPFTPSSSFAFARGQVKEKLIYNESGSLVKKIKNTYALNNDAEVVKGFKCETASINTVNGGFVNTNSNNFYIGYYDMVPKSIQLIETTEETYGIGTPLKNTMTYSYNSVVPSLLKTQNTINSDGESYLSEFKYVLDKDQVGFANQSEIDAANSMYAVGNHAALLENTMKNGNEVIGIKKIGYKKWTVNNKDLLLPETVYQGRVTAEPQVKYEAYDQNGNITQSSTKIGVKNSARWDQNRLYPILECTNASQDEIFFENFENNTNATVGNAHSGTKYLNGDYSVNFTITAGKAFKISYWFYENSEWHYSGYLDYTGPSMLLSNGDAIDDVIIIPQEAQVITKNYFPSVGLANVTDTKGLTTYYEYDNLQRLKYIKDDRRNIVKSNEYYEHPPYFYNNVVTGSFTKNDCDLGYVGETVRYYVGPNRFYSINSTAEATALATTYLNTTGQAYANSVGRCRLPSLEMMYSYSSSLFEICNFMSSPIAIESVRTYFADGKLYEDEYLTTPVRNGYYVRQGSTAIPVRYEYVEDGEIKFMNTCGQDGPVRFIYSATYPANSNCELMAPVTKYAFLDNPYGTISVGTVLSTSLIWGVPNGYYLANGMIYTVVDGVVTAENGCAYTPPAPRYLEMAKESLSIVGVCQSNNYSTYYYAGTFIGVGTVFYTNSALTIKAPPGYYYDGSSTVYIIVGNGEVYGAQTCQEIQDGIFLSHPPFQPAVEPTVFSFPAHYTTTRADFGTTSSVLLGLDLFSLTGSLNTPVSIGMPEQVFFTDAEMKIIAPEGYYTLSETDPAHVGFKFYYLRNGRILFIGFYDQVDPAH